MRRSSAFLLDITEYDCRLLLSTKDKLYFGNYHFGLFPFTLPNDNLDDVLEFVLEQAEKDFGQKLDASTYALVHEQFKGSKFVKNVILKREFLQKLNSSSLLYLDLNLACYDVLAKDVLRFLPIQMQEGEVESYLNNLKLFKNLLPTTSRDLYIEHAALKAYLRSMKSLGSYSGVIFGGRCAFGLDAVSALYLAADGLQPQEKYEVFIDRGGVFPLVKFLEGEGGSLAEPYELTYAGAVLSFAKKVSLGVERGFKKESKLDLAFGDILGLPAPQGEKLIFSFREGVRTRKWETVAGLAGVLVDCRGRPFNFPPPTAEGKSIIRGWNKALPQTV